MLKFLLGIGCGVALGLMFAPASGDETREQLLRAAQKPGDLAREKVAGIRQRVADMGADLGRQAAEKAIDRVVPEGLSGGQQRQG